MPYDDQNQQSNVPYTQLAGAAAGAALPAASLARYNLVSYPNIEKFIRETPYYHHSRLRNIARPGDIGMSGYPKPDKDSNLVARLSSAYGGSPFGHASVVDKKRNLNHGGAMADLDEKHISIDNLGSYAQALDDYLHDGGKLTDLMSNQNGAIQNFRQRVTKYQAVNQQHKKLMFSGKGGKPADVRGIPNDPDAIHKEYARTGAFGLYRLKDKRDIQPFLKADTERSYHPYSLSDATIGGLKSITAPNLGITKGLGANRIGSTCTDAVQCGLRAVGKNNARPRGSMTTDIHNNEHLTPAGLFGDEPQANEHVFRNKMLRRAGAVRKTRNLLGLGATVGMAGAGYGLGALGHHMFNQKTQQTPALS